MGFEALLGNDELKKDLAEARRKGKLAHFYLISGPEGSGKHTLADLLAAAMLCREPEGPCMRCRDCRKVMNHSHPDDITVDDPEKKTVSVDLIRRARADLFVRPNEGVRKIYRFPRAQDMGLPGQNALLKVLEEPPEYGVFLLLTDNPDKLLPTVRSRCVELKLRAIAPEQLRVILSREYPHADRQAIEAAMVRGGGYLGQARAALEGAQVSDQTRQFCQAFAQNDSLKLLQTLVPMERWKREALIPVLSEWGDVVEQALVNRAGLPGLSAEAVSLAAARSSRDLMTASAALKKAVQYAQGNVSCAAVCGYLEWALRSYR